MPKLSDLRDDLSDLSHDELLARIADIREDRKISKRAASVKKEREDRSVSKLAKAFAEMTDEEKAIIRKELLGE